MMKRITLVLLMVGLLSCGNEEYEKFYPHHVTHWRQTPMGHWRDAGPFGSVRHGYVTEEQIDFAVDSGFLRFHELFGNLGLGNPRIAINDDYVLYVRGQGWAGGVSWTNDRLWVCLWSRGYSDIDPGDQYIKRPPGESFGYHYTQWRYTTEPLMPAIVHELLHTCIGDPGHTSVYWSMIK